jgi:excisionase family DNA binding protein
LTLEQTAERLKVSKMTVLRLIGSGTLQAWQVCKGAPWAISEAQLTGLDVRMLPSRRPVTDNPDQQILDFQ